MDKPNLPMNNSRSLRKLKQFPGQKSFKELIHSSSNYVNSQRRSENLLEYFEARLEFHY